VHFRDRQKPWGGERLILLKVHGLFTFVRWSESWRTSGIYLFQRWNEHVELSNCVDQVSKHQLVVAYRLYISQEPQKSLLN
jgi:hypothetical protein